MSSFGTVPVPKMRTSLITIPTASAVLHGTSADRQDAEHWGWAKVWRAGLLATRAPLRSLREQAKPGVGVLWRCWKCGTYSRPLSPHAARTLARDTLAALPSYPTPWKGNDGG